MASSVSYVNGFIPARRWKMRVSVVQWSVVLVVLLAMLACAPRAVPQVAMPVSQPTPAATLAGPTSAMPLGVSPEEAAWAKVVEAAKKEGKVTHYATWVPQANEAITKAFESRYGIDVEIITGRGAEITERVKTERRIGQQVGDVTQSGAVLINNMKLEGLLVSVADELPALREKGVWWIEPTAFDPRDKTSLIYKITEKGPYINPRLVKPGEIPKTWKELLSPRWTGNLALNNPGLSSSPYEIMVILMDNKVWNEEYIRSLYRQKLRMTRDDTESLRLLATGEVHLSIASTDAFSATFAEEGAPIQAIAIEGAVVGGVVPAAAFAGGPHPNATRVYMNWLFSAEGQTVVGKALGNKLVRNDVPDFRPKVIQAPANKVLMVSLKQMEKATELFKEKWFDKLVGR